MPEGFKHHARARLSPRVIYAQPVRELRCARTTFVFCAM